MPCCSVQCILYRTYFVSFAIGLQVGSCDLLKAEHLVEAGIEVVLNMTTHEELDFEFQSHVMEARFEVIMGRSSVSCVTDSFMAGCGAIMSARMVLLVVVSLLCRLLPLLSLLPLSPLAPLSCVLLLPRCRRRCSC